MSDIRPQAASFSHETAHMLPLSPSRLLPEGTMLFRLRYVRSVALLALIGFAGCERSTVTPTSVDLVATESPQGRIAFVSGRDGNAEIYVMNADGSGVTRLTDNPAVDEAPAWSPDGTRLAFASTRDGNSEIYVMNADGSGVTRLTTDPNQDGHPAWCGTRIAFQSDRYLPPFYDIYVMNDDGTGPTRLTISNASSDEYPAWSPSCAGIAFTVDPGGNSSIDIMNADGSNRRGEVTGPGKNRYPAWSPDGTRLAFSTDRDDLGNIEEIYVTDAYGYHRLTVRSDFHTY